MNKEERIDSVIGKGTTIKGNIKVDGATKIDGTVEGNISAKESVIVGKGSAVKGNIACRNAIVGGRVEGNINAQEIIEFQGGAEMLGDIVCKGLIVQKGVFFEGNCRMSQKTKEKS